tara:strand:- start:50 stop:253 length:204 start_codon:yes stop_codon:yes gene_type:complete
MKTTNTCKYSISFVVETTLDQSTLFDIIQAYATDYLPEEAETYDETLTSDERTVWVRWLNEQKEKLS